MPLVSRRKYCEIAQETRNASLEQYFCDPSDEEKTIQKDNLEIPFQFLLEMTKELDTYLPQSNFMNFDKQELATMNEFQGQQKALEFTDSDFEQIQVEYHQDKSTSQ